jgi:Domain of unknown function (DUF397)
MHLDYFNLFKARLRFDAYHRSHGVFPAEIARASWRKSSASAYNGNCVEISRLEGNRIGIRDTKDMEQGPILIFTHAEWEAFLSGAKNGEFD